jgi:hypothetical protein
MYQKNIYIIFWYITMKYIVNNKIEQIVFLNIANIASFIYNKYKGGTRSYPLVFEEKIKVQV